MSELSDEKVVKKCLSGKFINTDLRDLIYRKILVLLSAGSSINIPNLIINIKNMYFGLIVSDRRTYIYSMNDNEKTKVTVTIPSESGREITILPAKIQLDQLYELCSSRGYRFDLDL